MTEREERLLAKLKEEIGDTYQIGYFHNNEYYEKEYDLRYNIEDEAGYISVSLMFDELNEIDKISIDYDNETDEEIVEMVKKKIEKGFDL